MSRGTRRFPHGAYSGPVDWGASLPGPHRAENEPPTQGDNQLVSTSVLSARPPAPRAQPARSPGVRLRRVSVARVSRPAPRLPSSLSSACSSSFCLDWLAKHDPDPVPRFLSSESSVRHLVCTPCQQAVSLQAEILLDSRFSVPPFVPSLPPVVEGDAPLRSYSPNAKGCPGSSRTRSGTVFDFSTLSRELGLAPNPVNSPRDHGLMPARATGDTRDDEAQRRTLPAHCGPRVRRLVRGDPHSGEYRTPRSHTPGHTMVTQPCRTAATTREPRRRAPVCGFVLLLREGCRRLRRTARWGSRRVRGGAAGTATGPRAFMVRRADDDD